MNDLEKRVAYLENALHTSEQFREQLIKQTNQKEEWDRKWKESHIDPLIGRIKSLGFEVVYGFEKGRNGDVSHSNIFDAVNLALDELESARRALEVK